MKFGNLLRIVKVNDLDIKVYSNKAPDFVSGEKSFDFEDNYLGLKYQCVELVRRYLYLKTKINYCSLWYEKNANADAWYDNAEKMNFKKFQWDEAAVGDIICFSGGLNNWGHVGVVTQILPNNQLIFTHQNLIPAVVTLHKQELFKNYKLQGFLRV